MAGTGRGAHAAAADRLQRRRGRAASGPDLGAAAGGPATGRPAATAVHRGRAQPRCAGPAGRARGRHGRRSQRRRDRADPAVGTGRPPGRHRPGRRADHRPAADRAAGTGAGQAGHADPRGGRDRRRRPARAGAVSELRRRRARLRVRDDPYRQPRGPVRAQGRGHSGAHRHPQGAHRQRRADRVRLGRDALRRHRRRRQARAVGRPEEPGRQGAPGRHVRPAGPEQPGPVLAGLLARPRPAGRPLPERGRPGLHDRARAGRQGRGQPGRGRPGLRLAGRHQGRCGGAGPGDPGRGRRV